MQSEISNNTKVDGVNKKKVLGPSKTLFEWEVQERIFKEKSREFYRRLAVIVIFFSLLAVIIKDIPLVLILGLSFFAVYVFHTIPPRKVVHKITDRGIDYASDYLYTWDELKNYWIEEKDGYKLLISDTVNPLPGRITLLLNPDVNIKNLQAELNNRLLFNENPSVPVYESMLTKVSSKFKLD